MSSSFLSDNVVRDHQLLRRIEAFVPDMFFVRDVSEAARLRVAATNSLTGKLQDPETRELDLLYRTQIIAMYLEKKKTTLYDATEQSAEVFDGELQQGRQLEIPSWFVVWARTAIASKN